MCQILRIATDPDSSIPIVSLGFPRQLLVTLPAAEPTPDRLEPLSRLMATLHDRARTRPAGSYTTRLLDGGVAKIASKIREEADEMIEAAESLETSRTADDAAAAIKSSRQHFIYEAGDLLYHTMVLLAQQGVDLGEVAEELGRREGVSGLEEKASRGNAKSTTSSADSSGGSVNE